MHKAKIYKAQGIGEQEVESLLIEFSEEILEDTMRAFENDSTTLEFLLYHVLPGGTYDRLLREMVKRKAGKLTVAYGDLDAS